MIFPSIYVDLSQCCDLEYPYIFFASLSDWIAFIEGEDSIDFPGRRNLDYTFKSFEIVDHINKDFDMLSKLSDDKVAIIDPELIRENLKSVYESVLSPFSSVRVIAISYKSQELAVMMRLLLN